MEILDLVKAFFRPPPTLLGANYFQTSKHTGITLLGTFQFPFIRVAPSHSPLAGDEVLVAIDTTSPGVSVVGESVELGTQFVAPGSTMRWHTTNDNTTARVCRRGWRIVVDN